MKPLLVTIQATTLLLASCSISHATQNLLTALAEPPSIECSQGTISPQKALTEVVNMSSVDVIDLEREKFYHQYLRAKSALVQHDLKRHKLILSYTLESLRLQRYNMLQCFDHHQRSATKNIMPCLENHSFLSL